MLQFNAMLFRCLPTLLGMPVIEIVQPLSYGRDTLTRAMNDGDLKVKYFLELINAYRIDITPFFIEQGDIEMPGSVTVEKGWKPTTLNIELLSTFGISPNTVMISQLTALMSMSSDVHNQMFAGGGHPKGYVDPHKGHSVRKPKKRNGVIAEEEDTNTYKRPNATNEWQFNAHLLEMTPKLIGVPATTMGHLLGHHRTTIAYAIERRDIKATLLTEICNRYHIPISHFMKPGIPENLVTPEAEWTPIEFHGERVAQITFHGEDTPMTKNRIARILDLDKRAIIAFTTNPQSVWISTIIRLCNFVGISPMFFFSSQDVAVNTRVTDGMQTDIKLLRSELEATKKRETQKDSRIRHLQALLDMTK